MALDPSGEAFSVNIPKPSATTSICFRTTTWIIVELQDGDRLRKQLEDFEQLLDSDSVDERAILTFINRKHAYFVVAALLKSYFHFGHHEAHLFPEFQLGNSYQVDYLLAGKSSGGWEFVFVELESPNGSTTLANGELGSSIRKGLAQVADWSVWLEAHYGAVGVAVAVLMVFLMGFLSAWFVYSGVATHHKRVISRQRAQVEAELGTTFVRNNLESLTDWQRKFLLRFIVERRMQIPEFEVGQFKAAWDFEMAVLVEKGIVKEHRRAGVFEIEPIYHQFLLEHWNRETGALE